METLLLAQKEAFEKYLKELFVKENFANTSLFEAANYSLLSPGKRLRPLLILSIAHALHTSLEKIYPLMAAIEMIHCYSLIHDDLPCMDDDDFRRGKPSLHKAFNEGIAVLTGDFLLTHAFTLLSELSTPPSIALKIIHLLSSSISSNGMIGGQMLDIEGENKSLTLQELENIHRLKTGALFAASFQAAALFCHADKETENTLTSFGAAFGKAFQIKDDVFDATKKRDGKEISPSSDEKNKKTTFVTLLGKEEAVLFASKLLKEEEVKVKALPYDFSLLFSLTH